MTRMTPAIVAALWFALLAWGATPALSAENKAKPKIANDEPIQIVSDRLEAYSEKRMVIFSGNAVATQGARTIHADRLIIYYREENRPAAKAGAEAKEGVGDLERIEAHGHVTVTEGERIATGEDAVFEQAAQKITMTGNAVLKEGPQVIRGDRVVVFLDENRGVVESSENKRVTATIYPEEARKKKAESPQPAGQRVAP